MKIRIAIFCCILLAGCAPLDQLLEEGDYDALISRGISRVERKPNDAHTKTLILEGIAKANQLDQARIDNYTSTDDPDQWVQAYVLYKKMQRRKDEASVVDLGGEPQDYSYEIEQVGREAARRLYARGVQKMENADKKEDYQSAYMDFSNVRSIDMNYPSIDSIRAASRSLGMKKVIFEVKDNPGFPLPLVAEQQFKKLDLSKLIEKDPWLEFHNSYQTGVMYDFVISLEVNEIKTTSPKTSKKKYTVTKEIISGYTYQKDSKGNVMRDAKGNPIRIPKKEKVRAKVYEYSQSKTARLGGLLTIMETRTGQNLLTKQLTANEVFQNNYATYSGDKKALNSKTLALAKRRKKPFPSNESMLKGAANQLNSNIQLWLFLQRKVFSE